MQLQLTLAERQLLADILEQRRYSLVQTVEPDRPTQEQKLKASEYEELFTKVVEKRLQFSSDELDTLMGVLRDRDREFRERGSSQDANWQVLQSLTDKIVELCAMV